MRRPVAKSGLNLVEVTMATLIVGLLLVAALNNVGASARGQLANGDRSRAALLAADLLAEIIEQPYVDAAGGTTLGPEAGETTGTRSAFDDVDDYASWSESPPKSKTGTAIANATGLTRAVSVQYVLATDLRTTTSSSNVKRVTVTVTRSGTTLGTISGLKAKP